MLIGSGRAFRGSGTKGASKVGKGTKGNEKAKEVMLAVLRLVDISGHMREVWSLWLFLGGCQGIRNNNNNIIIISFFPLFMFLMLLLLLLPPPGPETPMPVITSAVAHCSLAPSLTWHLASHLVHPHTFLSEICGFITRSAVKHLATRRQARIRTKWGVGLRIPRRRGQGAAGQGEGKGKEKASREVCERVNVRQSSPI